MYIKACLLSSYTVVIFDRGNLKNIWIASHSDSVWCHCDTALQRIAAGDSCRVVQRWVRTIFIVQLLTYTWLVHSTYTYAYATVVIVFSLQTFRLTDGRLVKDLTSKSVQNKEESPTLYCCPRKCVHTDICAIQLHFTSPATLHLHIQLHHISFAYPIASLLCVFPVRPHFMWIFSYIHCSSKLHAHAPPHAHTTF